MPAKGWDGNTPIVCKKKSGKLVWVKFRSSANSQTAEPTQTSQANKPEVQSVKNYVLDIAVFRPNTSRISANSGTQAGCDKPWTTHPAPERSDIHSETTIEILSGTNSIVGVGVLGLATLVLPEDNNPNLPGAYADPTSSVYGKMRGICIFQTKVTVQKSDFYRIKIGKTEATGSFETLEQSQWKFRLKVTSFWLPYENELISKY